eukprot:759009-Hanusia_phi.AAC.6
MGTSRTRSVDDAEQVPGHKLDGTWRSTSDGEDNFETRGDVIKCLAGQDLPSNPNFIAAASGAY